MDFSSIDIFCHVIDNYGDAGVVYRFANEFKNAHPRCRVRVFIDNLHTLCGIVPEIDNSTPVQEYKSITYVNTTDLDRSLADSLGIADIMIEAFACHIPEPFMEKAYFQSKLIINLEYLSAEDWVEDFHLKESLLGKGTVKKYFFMPGFTENTGGLILNSDLKNHKRELVAKRHDFIDQVLKSNQFHFQDLPEKTIGTVFTYERGFDTMLRDLMQFNKDTLLLLFGHKTHNSMISSLKRLGVECSGDRQCNFHSAQILFIPFIDQHSYDSLLCCTDFNIVRGEDSLARAAISGKPFIWNAYLQEEKYQKVKVLALLKVLQPYFNDNDLFDSYSRLMLEFNNALKEDSTQVTEERYDSFFRNLNKIEHATEKFSYFIDRKCDLIAKLSDFLREFN